jgi:hypothetical protein
MTKKNNDITKRDEGLPLVKKYDWELRWWKSLRETKYRLIVYKWISSNDLHTKWKEKFIHLAKKVKKNVLCRIAMMNLRFPSFPTRYSLTLFLVLSDSCCFRIMERFFSRESIRQTVNNPKCTAAVVSCCYCCCDPFHWNQIQRYGGGYLFIILPPPLIPIIIAYQN